jgi:hypothetical protein
LSERHTHVWITVSLFAVGEQSPHLHPPLGGGSVKRVQGAHGDQGDPGTGLCDKVHQTSYLGLGETGSLNLKRKKGTVSDEYQKIPGPFKREVDGPNRNKIIDGQWSSPELECLEGASWLWTEKVDGTNIRIFWDGHKVTYGGRTDNAQIPAKLIAVLDTLVTEELFEQQFGGTPATLYGEGYGAGIQKGGIYRTDMSFVLFDVRVGDWWLLRRDVEDVAKGMGLDAVPVFGTGSIPWAINLVRRGIQSYWNSNVTAEGLVGTTVVGLRDRSGARLIVKVKTKDFKDN